MPFGKRAQVYSGAAPLKDILDQEASTDLARPGIDVDWDTKAMAEVGMEVRTRRQNKMLVTGETPRLTSRTS